MKLFDLAKQYYKFFPWLKAFICVLLGQSS